MAWRRRTYIFLRPHSVDGKPTVWFLSTFIVILPAVYMQLATASPSKNNHTVQPSLMPTIKIQKSIHKTI